MKRFFILLATLLTTLTVQAQICITGCNAWDKECIEQTCLTEGTIEPSLSPYIITAPPGVSVIPRSLLRCFNRGQCVFTSKPDSTPVPESVIAQAIRLYSRDCVHRNWRYGFRHPSWCEIGDMWY
jgi:hypothetical protein